MFFKLCPFHDFTGSDARKNISEKKLGARGGLSLFFEQSRVLGTNAAGFKQGVVDQFPLVALLELMVPPVEVDVKYGDRTIC